MKITFCLLQPGRAPIGGYKIVYEYAERLQNNGHSVTIIYDASTLFRKDKYLVRVLKTAIRYNRFRNWFQPSRNIKIRYAMNGLQESVFKKADCVIATAVETAEPVAKLSPAKGRKIYFVQDIENWRLSDEELHNTYAMPFTIITISSWIKSCVDKYSLKPSYVVPNALDFKQWGIDIKVEDRPTASVSMLYHKLPHKGSKYGVEALLMLKKEIPDLTVEMFGVPERPDNLPDWVRYTQKASSEELRRIYNNTAIFLCPTIKEGFGLTGAESMACGCALVTTNYGGVREYAVDGENCVMCEVENATSLCNGMMKLIRNPKIRIELAQKGANDIKQLNWENSVNKFESILMGEGENETHI